jgi:ankyrin repeat protein
MTERRGPADLPDVAEQGLVDEVRARVRSGLSLEPAMKQAIERGSLAHVQLLQAHGAPLAGLRGVSYDSALELSIKKGHVELTRYLFDQGVAVSESPTLVASAAKQGSAELVQLCLDRGADVNAVAMYYSSREWSALSHAAWRGDDAMVDVLLRHPGMIVDQPGDPHQPTPMMRAAARGHLRTVQRLVEAGAEVNFHAPLVQGGYREELEAGTAYSLARSMGHFEVAGYLLAKGADPTLSTVSGPATTRLHGACVNGDLASARAALADGAALEARWKTAPPHGGTLSALERAVSHGRIEIVDLLCAAGAKLIGYEYDDACGARLFELALHSADPPAMVEHLRTLGVDPRPGKYGKDPSSVPPAAAPVDLRPALIAWAEKHGVAIDQAAARAASGFAAALAPAFGTRACEYHFDSGYDERTTFAELFDKACATLDGFNPTMRSVEWLPNEERILIAFELNGQACRIRCTHDGGAIVPDGFWHAMNRFARKRWQHEWVICLDAHAYVTGVCVPSPAARSLRRLVDRYTTTLLP